MKKRYKDRIKHCYQCTRMVRRSGTYVCMDQRSGAYRKVVCPMDECRQADDEEMYKRVLHEPHGTE